MVYDHRPQGVNPVVRVDPGTGVATTFPEGSAGGLGGIVVAQNGNLMFVRSHPTPSLTEISPTGALVRQIALPGRAQITSQVIRGRGATLWVAARGYVARVTNGAVKTFRMPFGGLEWVTDLANGPGNAVVFSSLGAIVGRISASGRVNQIRFRVTEATYGGRGPQLATSDHTVWFVGPRAGLYAVTGI